MDPLIWGDIGGKRSGSETIFLPCRHHSGKVAEVEFDRGSEDVDGVQSRLHLSLGHPVALHLHTWPAWGRRDGLREKEQNASSAPKYPRVQVWHLKHDYPKQSSWGAVILLIMK